MCAKRLDGTTTLWFTVTGNDLRTSIQLAEAVAGIKPLWLEDPLPVEYSEDGKRLVTSTNVPICRGDNFVRRQGSRTVSSTKAAIVFAPIFAIPADFLETKRIADMAEVFGLPMATQNTGCMVNTMATAQWAGSIRDFIHWKTVLGRAIGWATYF